MNKYDEIADEECPYCDGIMIDGQCRDCGWSLERDYPPMEEK